MCSDQPAERGPQREQHAVGRPDSRDRDVDDQRVRAVPHVHRDRLRHLGARPGSNGNASRGAPVIGLGVHQGPQHPVVERQHLVALRLRPPQVDERGQQLGVLRRRGPASPRGPPRRGTAPRRPRRTARSGPVVVQRPDRVERHRLPAAVVDGPRAEHLEVLRGVPLGGALAPGAEQVAETHAVDRGLRDAVDLGRAVEPRELEQRRGDVDRVRELAADAPPSRDPRGQETMHGSATPPSCTSRFHRRNGVFPAMVQPHG